MNNEKVVAEPELSDKDLMEITAGKDRTIVINPTPRPRPVVYKFLLASLLLGSCSSVLAQVPQAPPVTEELQAPALGNDNHVVGSLQAPAVMGFSNCTCEPNCPCVVGECGCGMARPAAKLVRKGVSQEPPPGLLNRPAATIPLMSYQLMQQPAPLMFYRPMMIRPQATPMMFGSNGCPGGVCR